MVLYPPCTLLGKGVPTSRSEALSGLGSSGRGMYVPVIDIYSFSLQHDSDSDSEGRCININNEQSCNYHLLGFFDTN